MTSLESNTTLKIMEASVFEPCCICFEHSLLRTVVVLPSKFDAIGVILLPSAKGLSIGAGIECGKIIP